MLKMGLDQKLDLTCLRFWCLKPGGGSACSAQGGAGPEAGVGNPGVGPDPAGRAVAAQGQRASLGDRQGELLPHLGANSVLFCDLLLLLHEAALKAAGSAGVPRVGHHRPLDQPGQASRLLEQVLLFPATCAVKACMVAWTSHISKLCAYCRVKPGQRDSHTFKKAGQQMMLMFHEASVPIAPISSLLTTKPQLILGLCFRGRVC